MSLTVPNLCDKVLSILIEQEKTMKPIHAVITALATFLAAIIITILIVVHQPVGHWYYMTDDQRLWFSIGAGGLTFLWVLVLVIWGILFAKSVDY